jgi:hypothetical protein
VLQQVMGFEPAGSEGSLSLYRSGAPIGHSVLIDEIDPPAYGQSGRGIVHQRTAADTPAPIVAPPRTGARA